MGSSSPLVTHAQPFPAARTGCQGRTKPHPSSPYLSVPSRTSLTPTLTTGNTDGINSSSFHCALVSRWGSPLCQGWCLRLTSQCRLAPSLPFSSPLEPGNMEGRAQRGSATLPGSGLFPRTIPRHPASCPPPQHLTWPGTSPLPRIARSTDGLSARRWKPARSWGPGLSQGGLERRGENTAPKGSGWLPLALRTSSTKLLAILPSQGVLGSRRSGAAHCLYSLVVWEPLRHPRRFGRRTRPRSWRERASGGWTGVPRAKA